VFSFHVQKSKKVLIACPVISRNYLHPHVLIGIVSRPWRRAELLPVRYFHTVFTLPHDLNGLIDANRKLLLGELFSAVNWVLQRFAADPRWRLEGQIGFIAILHTWTQRLQEHFHLHCIIPGGVWQEKRKRWIPCRGKWLFRKNSLADAFRNRFLKRLETLRRDGSLSLTGAAAVLATEMQWNSFIAGLRAQRWIVYPKPAPDGAGQVLEYFGRYTHKVAISDHRIIELGNGHVTYTWRDRADGNKLKTDRLPVEEFIRRFLYHILPNGFQKIRHYGWLSANSKKTALPAIRIALKAQPPSPPPEESFAERILRLTGKDISSCPFCGKGRLVRTQSSILPARAPP